MIPLLDLQAEYVMLKEEIMNGINGVFNSGSFILGKKVEELESRIADYIGVSYAVGVANGTDALLLSMLAMGIGPGDEVVTSPFTFFATAEAIVRSGATPVFADIDPVTYNLDPQQIKKLLTKRTKAIVPVHLFGQACDMEPIMLLAKEHGLKVIEDACQSIGAYYKGKQVGSFGDGGCFSFFPSKNLGAYGDGGMIVTNDKAMYDKILALRNHGSYEKYVHVCIGLNSRLDEIQAAILLCKLKRLTEWNLKREAIARRYTERLSSVLHTPVIVEGRQHVFHQYCVEADQRDQLAAFLQKKQVATGIYYPIPLHLQQAFHYLSYRQADFPVAENAAKRILALPIHPMLTDEQQDYIISSILHFMGEINGLN